MHFSLGLRCADFSSEYSATANAHRSPTTFIKAMADAMSPIDLILGICRVYFVFSEPRHRSAASTYAGGSIYARQSVSPLIHGCGLHSTCPGTRPGTSPKYWRGMRCEGPLQARCPQSGEGGEVIAAGRCCMLSGRTYRAMCGSRSFTLNRVAEKKHSRPAA